MRSFLCGLLIVAATGATASAATVLRITRVSTSDQRLNVEIRNARLSAVLKALELHLASPVTLETGSDPVVTYRALRVLPRGVLADIVDRYDLVLEPRDGGWLAIRDPHEPTVTLDVKDAEIGIILSELKRQCGIRNIMVDPEIKDQKGTFLLNEVPCTTAFKVIFNSLGLAAQVEPNSVLNVESPR